MRAVPIKLPQSLLLLVLLHLVVLVHGLAGNNHALQEIRPSESLAPIAKPSAVVEQKPSPPHHSASPSSSTLISADFRLRDEELQATGSVSPSEETYNDTNNKSPSDGHADTASDTLDREQNTSVTQVGVAKSKDDENADEIAPITSPAATPAETIEEVFVPLKEWKQRRLEDIESRVRQINEGEIYQSSGSVPRKGTRPHLVASERNRSDVGTGTCPVPTLSMPWLSTRDNTRCMADALNSVDKHAATGAVKRSFYRISPSVTPHETTNDAGARVVLDSDPLSADASLEMNAGLPSLSAPYSNVSLYGPQPELSKGPSIGQTDPRLQLFDVAGSNGTNSSTQELIESRREQNSSLFFVVDWTAVPLVGNVMKFLKGASTQVPSSPEQKPCFPSRAAGYNPLPRGNVNTSATDNCGSANTFKGDPHTANGRDHVSFDVDTERQTQDARRPADESILRTASAEGEGSGKGPTETEKPFNFASADAGARILSSSSGIVGAKNVIEGSVDKYLLAPCTGGVGDSRWIEIELSEDVILESLETGNFEYYSSSARKLVVLGAGSYPPRQWNLLGVFEFAHVRSLQRFRIQKRVVTRYLRILFAGKQGHEYYCPVSTIRAFGKNLIADWKTVFERPLDSTSTTHQRGEDLKKRATPDEGPSSLTHSLADTPREKSSLYVETERVNLEWMTHRSLHYNKKPYRQFTGEQQQLSDEVGEDSKKDERTAQREDAESPPILAERREKTSENETDNRTETNESNAGPQPETQSLPSGMESAEALAREAMSEEDQIVLEAVRADALSSVAGDDNIFRKVTRLIRMLELNQTLTNQYIDTHLARFAKALSKAQADSSKARQVATLSEQQLIRFVASTEKTVRDLRSSVLKRDVLLCILIVCVAFLLGTHWVLWTAVSGARLYSHPGSISGTGFEMDVGVEEDTVSTSNADQLQRDVSGHAGIPLVADLKLPHPYSGRSRSVSSTVLSTFALKNAKK